MHDSIVHGRRPGDVWFLLLCICMERGLPFDIAQLIHTHIIRHASERRAIEIVLERRERETIARSEHGAELPTPLWRLLGFGCLLEFLVHKRLELSQAKACKMARLNASLPVWKAFGFETQLEYHRHMQQMLIS